MTKRWTALGLTVLMVGALACEGEDKKVTDQRSGERILPGRWTYTVWAEWNGGVTQKNPGVSGTYVVNGESHSFTNVKSLRKTFEFSERVDVKITVKADGPVKCIIQRSDAQEGRRSSERNSDEKSVTCTYR